MTIEADTKITVFWYVTPSCLEQVHWFQYEVTPSMLRIEKKSNPTIMSMIRTHFIVSLLKTWHVKTAEVAVDREQHGNYMWRDVCKKPARIATSCNNRGITGSGVLCGCKRGGEAPIVRRCLATPSLFRDRRQTASTGTLEHRTWGLYGVESVTRWQPAKTRQIKKIVGL
jgi:hypothetical protein